MQEDQIVLKLTGGPIVVGSDFAEVNLLPEGLTINWELTIDGLNADFGSLDGSLVDKFVIVVCIDGEVVFGAAKVVDALVYGDLVGEFLWAKDIDDVLEIWILGSSFVLDLLFVEIGVVIGVDEKIDYYRLAELAGLPTGRLNHFQF